MLASLQITLRLDPDRGSGFRSVVVITFALHAKGLRFAFALFSLLLFELNCFFFSYIWRDRRSGQRGGVTACRSACDLKTYRTIPRAGSNAVIV